MTLQTNVYITFQRDAQDQFADTFEKLVGAVENHDDLRYAVQWLQCRGHLGVHSDRLEDRKNAEETCRRFNRLSSGGFQVKTDLGIWYVVEGGQYQVSICYNAEAQVFEFHVRLRAEDSELDSLDAVLDFLEVAIDEDERDVDIEINLPSCFDDRTFRGDPVTVWNLIIESQRELDD